MLYRYKLQNFSFRKAYILNHITLHKKKVLNQSNYIQYFWDIIQFIKLLFRNRSTRVYLKNHSHDLHSQVCREFIPNLVSVACYIMPFGYTS